MAFPPWTGYNFTSTIHHKVPEHLRPSSQSLKDPFVVCITGASRGIGAATAKAFAEAGATGLILTARTEPALHETVETCKTVAASPSLKISTVGVDIGSDEAAPIIARVIRNEHGRLDALINNAGVMSTNSSAFERLESVDDDQFQYIMKVNYIGRFQMIKHLIPILLETPGGAKTIVNISSLSSHLTSGSPLSFNISELANNRLTEGAAEMYSQDGVMVYAVHPGMVTTTFPPGFPEEFKAVAIDEAGICGAFLVWLVKEKRSWLSGRYLSSNWDVTELEGRRDEIVQRDKLKMRMVV